MNIRRIYSPDAVFGDRSIAPYEVLHEWMILSLANGEYYGVIAILGIEYAINLGGPELLGFQQWLSEHNDRSPLYCE